MTAVGSRPAYGPLTVLLDVHKLRGHCFKYTAGLVKCEIQQSWALLRMDCCKLCGSPRPPLKLYICQRIYVGAKRVLFGNMDTYTIYIHTQYRPYCFVAFFSKAFYYNSTQYVLTHYNTLLYTVFCIKFFHLYYTIISLFKLIQVVFLEINISSFVFIFFFTLLINVQRYSDILTRGIFLWRIFQMKFFTFTSLTSNFIVLSPLLSDILCFFGGFFFYLMRLLIRHPHCTISVC